MRAPCTLEICIDYRARKQSGERQKHCTEQRLNQHDFIEICLWLGIGCVVPNESIDWEHSSAESREIPGCTCSSGAYNVSPWPHKALGKHQHIDLIQSPEWLPKFYTNSPPHRVIHSSIKYVHHTHTQHFRPAPPLVNRRVSLSNLNRIEWLPFRWRLQLEWDTNCLVFCLHKSIALYILMKFN